MPNYFIVKLAKILNIWRICHDDLLSTPYFPCHYGILMKKGRKRDDISLILPHISAHLFTFLFLSVCIRIPPVR